MQFKTFDTYFPAAKQLRTEFDRRFKNPLQPRADRFVWDYWHVPGEYTLLRTQAHAFFTRKLYERFHRHLVEWGRENLGCHDVSPPWLSCYVEGCRQERHADVPHGPLAFVYSLTPWSARKFSGGETFLEGHKDVPAKFNRLLVFNPALPHGVREVRGTHDPRFGRLVIHGWFVNPRPFWYGPLSVNEISEGVETGLGEVLSGKLNLGRGLLSVRLKIANTGRVNQVQPLVNTLVGGESRDTRELLKILGELRFSKHRSSTDLTLPLMVE